jgi:hypothetical protein
MLLLLLGFQGAVLLEGSLPGGIVGEAQVRRVLTVGGIFLIISEPIVSRVFALSEQ